MTTVLFGLAYSPWTERARWALDHHRIDYFYEEHVPMLGEPWLRWNARGSGLPRASVPLLRTDGRAIGDSVAIMAWADSVGRGESLRADTDHTRSWADRIELGVHAVRSRVTAAILADPEAQRESAQAAVPASLAGVFSPLAAMGARFIASKYNVDLRAVDAARRQCRETLLLIRGTLDGGFHLVGHSLSAVDLMAATFVQGIQPVSARHLALTPAVYRAWCDAELAEEFEDIVKWRDEMYRKHRRSQARI